MSGRLLFFDTETTGKNPNKAICLQLAGTFIDPVRKRKMSFNDILNHRQLEEIPQPASDVHGIYLEDLERCGIDPYIAFTHFLEIVKQSDFIIAHNIIYDIGILKTLAKYLAPYNGQASEDLRKAFAGKELVCTMKICKDILKLPATVKQLKAGFGPYKNPKLSEAYKFFFNEEMTGAHDAQNDVRATMKIFFKIRQLYT